MEKQKKYKQFYDWSLEELKMEFKQFLEKNKIVESKYELEDYFDLNFSYPDDVFDAKLGFVSKEDIRFVYCCLVNSLQSSSYTNFVNFKDKDKGHAKAFCKLLCNFVPETVVDKYKNKNEEWKSIDNLLENVIDELGIKEEIRKRRGVKLAWESFVTGLYNGAKYLSKFKNGNEFKKDLEEKAVKRKSINHNAAMIKAMIEVKKENDIVGLGETLVADFLKDSGIIDCGKPDVHIKEVLKEIFTNEGSEQELLRKIADAASVSVYQVDRIIWLLCTNEFYMHGAPKNTGSKRRDKYIERTKRELQEA
jgi:hypothetical protein